jgi:hypothetical protein
MSNRKMHSISYIYIHTCIFDISIVNLIVIISFINNLFKFILQYSLPIN